MTLQKITNRAMHRYLNDNDFTEEPYFAVTVLNTHDNPNEYEPPNPDIEGEIDELTGIRMKEQSLVLSSLKMGLH